MGSRARRALTAAAFFAAGQNPPPADTTTPELILNEVFAGASALVPRVVLSEGIAYRVEIQPAAATISVRSARRPTLPPLLLLPLSGEALESGSATYLLVPRSTEEFRIDVAATGPEPVRVRIWRDPKESSRWARMREATKGLPMAGFGLRAVYIGPFVQPASGFVGTPPGKAEAVGAEACLAVVPRGGWLRGPVGGCVITIGHYWRGHNAHMLLLGTAPRLLLTPPAAPIETSVVVTAGIGTDTQMHSDDYLALSIGLEVAVPVTGPAHHLWLDAEGSIARMQQLGAGLEPKGPAYVVPRLAAGLQLRF